MNLDFESEFLLKVYLEDTDAYGVVYHSKYLNFLERARSDWFSQQDKLLSDYLGKDISFAVSHIDIRFLKPAKLENELVIKTKIERHKLSLYRFNQSIFHQNEAIIRAKVDVISIDAKSLKPTRAC